MIRKLCALLYASLVCAFVATPRAFATVDSAQKTLDELTEIGINDNTDPKIRELYETLNKNIEQYNNLKTEHVDALTENSDAMHKKEQSTANKIIGAVGIGATGIGTMQAASALAEQRADQEADADMRAYLATFTCDYGRGRNIQGGETSLELPGGNDMIDLYAEYAALAQSLAVRKSQLELSPGIEAEVVIDKADTNLYDNGAVGKTDGAYASLARAIMDENGADAQKINEIKDATAKKLKTGAIVAGVGAIGSAVANLIANKDAPKERSREINTEYGQKIQAAEKEVDGTEQELNKAIADNQVAIAEYNKQLKQHQELANGITDPDCKNQFKDYLKDIQGRKPIENGLQNMANLSIDYDLENQKRMYDACVAAAQLARKKAECEKKDKHYWDDETQECLQAEEPDLTEVAQDAPATPDEDKKEEDAAQSAPADPNQCPADNPRMKSLNESTYVGDNCRYGNVTTGRVFKFAAGTKRNGVDVGGTCSCTALTCASGYKVEKGMCVATDATPTDATPKSDSKAAAPNGQCLRTVISKDKEMGYMACTNLCLDYAAENKCNFKDSDLDHTYKNCICNSDVLPRDDYWEQEKGGDANALDYYAVCTTDKNKSGGKEYCVEFFANTRVTMDWAQGLAQEWALLATKDDILCKIEDPQKYKGNYYLKCTSVKNKTYYEFKFGTLRASIDAIIDTTAMEAICRMHGAKYKAATKFMGDRCEVKNTPLKCPQIDKSFKRFGYRVWDGQEHKNRYKDTCFIEHNDIYDKAELRSEFGIDNFRFCSEQIQLSGGLTYKAYLRQYIRDQAAARGVPIKVLRCEDGARRYTGGGCVGGINLTDDVVTCYADGKPIDFVFDDLSERFKSYDRGGRQGMACIVADGTFTGRECTRLDEAACNRLIAASHAECPSCEMIYWEPETESCLLPASASQADFQRNVKYATIAGMAVAGAAITVTTAGTGTGALVVVLIEVTGAAMEIGAQHDIDFGKDGQGSEAEKFLHESGKCKDASCAESLLRQHMHRLANMQNDFQDQQVRAIDEELARLFELLDEDSEIYNRMLEKGDISLNGQKNKLLDMEPEQWIRAIGVAMQMAGLVEVMFKLIKKAPKALSKTTSAISKKMASKVERNAASHVDDGIKMTPTQAKRLDEIDARLAKVEGTPNSHTETVKLRQERNEILNKVGTKDEEVIAAAKANAFSEREVANAQKELDEARAAFARQRAWEDANPGAAKNNLQSRNSSGRTAREKLMAAEKKARDMGIDVTPTDMTPPANIKPANWDEYARGAGLANGADTATDAARTAENAGSTVRNTPTETPRTAPSSTAAPRDAEIHIPAGRFDDTAEAARAANNADNARTANRAANSADNTAGGRSATTSAERRATTGSDSATANRSRSASNTNSTSAANRGAAAVPTPSPSGATAAVSLRDRADDMFDAWLTEFKSSGRTKTFDKARLTDDEWRALSEEISRTHGVHLEDSGMGTMMFKNNADDVADVARAANNADNARTANRAASNADNTRNANNAADAARHSGAFDPRAVELNENELVRTVGNGGNPVNTGYVQASKDARQHLSTSLASGQYTRSADDYIRTMNEMHAISANGASGNINWYSQAGQGSIPVNPGKIRASGRMVNSRTAQAETVEQIARQYGDPFRVQANSDLRLPGIPENNLPQNRFVNGRHRHYYPSGGDDLRPYYQQMYRTSSEALDLIDSGASERAILEKLAEHYQYAANARPYGQINNSMFMNEVNTLLQRAGMQTMPHGELDITAMHLQPDTFKKYFVDTYYKTRLPRAAGNGATARNTARTLVETGTAQTGSGAQTARSATNAADNARGAARTASNADAARAANNADNARNANRAASNTSTANRGATAAPTPSPSGVTAAASLRDRADDMFDAWLTEFKSSGRTKTFDKAKLTDDEWRALSEEISRTHGVHLEDSGMGTMVFKNDADDVVETFLAAPTRGVTSTAEAQAANIATLRRQASSNFDAYLDEARRLGRSEHIIPKERLTDAGWYDLNRALAADDVQLVEVTQNGKQYMQFITQDADDVIETVRVADSMDNAARGAGALAGRARAADAMGEYMEQNKRAWDRVKGLMKQANESGATKEIKERAGGALKDFIQGMVEHMAKNAADTSEMFHALREGNWGTVIEKLGDIAESGLENASEGMLKQSMRDLGSMLGDAEQMGKILDETFDKIDDLHNMHLAQDIMRGDALSAEVVEDLDNVRYFEVDANGNLIEHAGSEAGMYIDDVDINLFDDMDNFYDDGMMMDDFAYNAMRESPYSAFGDRRVA